MSWLPVESKAGGNSWPLNRDSLGFPCFWLLEITAGLLWRWMENSSMMQVIVQLSSLANNSQKTWWARWNKDEHNECFIVHVSDAMYCIQGETQISMWVRFGLLGLCLLLLYFKSRVYHWLKGEQNLTHLSNCFLRSCVCRLCGITMRWAYEKLSGFNATVLRHLSVRVVNTNLSCPCFHLVLNILTRLCCWFKKSDNWSWLLTL